MDDRLFLLFGTVFTVVFVVGIAHMATVRWWQERAWRRQG